MAFPAGRPFAPPPAVSGENVVPFDYGASFQITGTPGAIRQDVINISADAAFVAVAIGYGFEEERGRPAVARVSHFSAAGAPVGAVEPGDVTLGELPVGALVRGFRVQPEFHHLVFTNPVPGTPPELSNQPLTVDFFNSSDSNRRPTVFQEMRHPADITFLFSMVDSSSGRELQDEPTHNLAALGKSNGERPFRWLAQPLTFMPRSTLRLQVIERTEAIRGTLFIVLYGYSVLASTVCSEEAARQMTAQAAAMSQLGIDPDDRAIPFDYVTTFQLTGRPRNVLEAEATVSADGRFVATALGYSLLVEEQNIPLLWENVAQIQSAPAGSAISALPAAVAAFRNRPEGATTPAEPLVDLSHIPLRAFPPSVLLEGFRLKPDCLRIAFQTNGALANALPVTWLDRIFERLNRPEDVAFRYVISDSGRGRELQNQALNNIAGLGTATGKRPFKRLARPLVFLPRSTIRVRIEEVFGRGTLFIVFQGYKTLGPSTRTGGLR